MANIFSGLALAFQYLPHVLGAVQAVETSIGDTAPGAAKKEIVLSAIVAACKIGEQVPESHVAIISALIDSVVSALNGAGIFKKKVAAIPVPAAAPAA